MIAESIQQDYTNTKYYYQFTAILEHMIDCLQTIVSDETNPYHPPLAWLTRKQMRPPDDELFLDLIEECSRNSYGGDASIANSVKLSSSIRTRLERCPRDLRKDIVSRTRDGCSPLFVACKNGLTSVARYLLDACGADIEQKGSYEAFKDHHIHSVSPIWVAAVSDNIDTVKMLIDHGADINSLSDTGSTPLRSVCYLCRDDDGDQAELEQAELFSFGAHEDEFDDDSYMKIVRLLIDNGADVAKSNYNGGTCLINSVHSHRLTDYIISVGADVNACDHQNKTALHYAIQHGKLEIVRLLLERGADPLLRTNCGDDALQLCCIGAHLEIFKLLTETFTFPSRRLIDAYKLLGSSILEIHYDLSKVRELWQTALHLQQALISMNIVELQEQSHQDREEGNIVSPNVIRGDREECDIRRPITFGDMLELEDEHQLDTLSADDFRIQSLLMSERILGPNHRETIQRLLYRGTFYINSLRPGRCLDLWIYALELRLKYNSIFHLESILTAQAITKLFLDLYSQQQNQILKFQDVDHVLGLLVGRLDECKYLLSWKPSFYLHEDIFDLLLGTVVNLLTILGCLACGKLKESERCREIISQLARKNPTTSDGSSLLHICVAPAIFDGEIHRSLRMVMATAKVTTAATDNATQSSSPPPASLSPLAKLIESFIDNGLDIDSANGNQLSPLQVLCLAGISGTDKRHIIRLLVERGAHVDRRTLTQEQGELIRNALREAGVDTIKFVSLSCLAARKVAESQIKFDKNSLARSLRESIAIH